MSQDRLNFRAWDGKEMKEVLSLEFDNHGSFEAVVHGKATHCDNMHEHIGPKWVMQSPGLRDKNDNLIFDDDLVNMKGTICVIKVEYDGGRFFEPLSEDNWCDDWNFLDDHERCEIIGNIHENPELLKQGGE